MNLLAFDTATDRMSIAVQRGERVFSRHGAGGAQASAALIPAVHALLAEAGLVLGDVAAIAFGRGPGSFTGLRTACSVAQGLAWGAGLPVLPIDTLMAVAESARARHVAERVLALLDARMGEVYAAEYAWHGAGWRVLAEPAVMTPGDVRAVAPDAGMGTGARTADETGAGSAREAPRRVLAGNAFAAHGDALPQALAALPRIQAWPEAEALLALAPALLAAGAAVPPEAALPLYIRDKVAMTTLERAAEKTAEKTAEKAAEKAAEEATEKATEIAAGPPGERHGGAPLRPADRAGRATHREGPA